MRPFLPVSFLLVYTINVLKDKLRIILSDTLLVFSCWCNTLPQTDGLEQHEFIDLELYNSKCQESLKWSY
jgi:hypothetical protein